MFKANIRDRNACLYEFTQCHVDHGARIFNASYCLNAIYQNVSVHVA